MKYVYISGSSYTTEKFAEFSILNISVFDDTGIIHWNF